MNKKKMRLLALLLAVVFVVCGCFDNSGKGVSDLVGIFKNKSKGDGEAEQEIEEYVTPEMRGEIRISCFGALEFLDAAARQFMEKYPEINIVINGNSLQSDTLREEEYQTSFNTELMSGEGADIIFNSFLPVTKYSEMGAFEDLSKYIKQTPEMNDENYFMNVLKAAENENGEIFIIPYKAVIPTLGFSTDLLKEHSEIENSLADRKNISYSDGMNYAEQLIAGKSSSDNYFLMNMNQIEIMEYLIKDALDDFINQEKKEVHLETGEYIDMLNSVKKIADEGFLDADIDFYNTEFHFAGDRDFDVQAAGFSVNPQSGKSYSMPLADRQGKVKINTNSTCIALNSASQHKELAWEFMKYLLSDEVQSMPSFYGLAVNRKGFEKSVEREYGKGVSGSMDDYRNLLESWMEQVNACDMLDGPIVSLLELEHEKFFDGQQSAEETAKELQKQIEQYFNE